MNKHIVLNNLEFVPANWKECFGSGKVYMFNPSIIKGEEDWIFAYRMIGLDGLRRIALCRLDSDYKIKKKRLFRSVMSLNF
jgi:hypothetical protein